MARVGTAGPRVERFLARYLRHTKGQWSGQPVVCEPWQQFLLDELFTLDAAGRRRYRSGLVGIPRKNAKSTLCAGVALYMLGPDGEPGPEVYTGGGSADQAGIVFGQVKEFLEANPRLLDWFIPRERTVRLKDAAGFMRRLAADGRLNHGLNPHAVIIDELHAFTTPRQVDNYEALTTAGGARAEPLVLAISTAGDDPDTILGRQYRRLMEHSDAERIGKGREKLRAGLTILREPDNGRIALWWGADPDADIENPAVWRAANPASWISTDYLREQFTSTDVDEASFRKLHLNQFVTSRDAWLPWGTWAGLVSTLEVPDRIAIGVDVGLTADTTAVSWAAPVEDDDGATRIVVRSHVWAARDDVPHDTYVPGGRVDLQLVEEFIRDLARRYSVARLHYDPRFFERSAQLLSGEGMTVAPLNQSSAPMADAYHEWYVDARTDVTAHDGDPVLAAHVDSTAGVQTERGWRVSKLRSNRRIDACVAAVMATYGARRIDDALEPEPWVGIA